MKKLLLAAALFLFIASPAFCQYGEKYDPNNSRYNPENSRYNPENSKYNPKNSIYTPNNPRLTRDNDGNVTGYKVPKKSGGNNYFDKNGNRTGYDTGR